MSSGRIESLSKRERQIMDVIFQLGDATVGQVREGLADPPSYSAVRATIGILVDKGWLAHSRQGRQYVYRPTMSRLSARRSALSHVMETFFAGSTEDAVAALLDLRPGRLEEAELERIEKLIQKAREERS